MVVRQMLQMCSERSRNALRCIWIGLVLSLNFGETPLV